MTASEHQRRAQRHPSTSHVSAYSPGTEYALVLAETQLMGAVISVLTESLAESVKGFYKLRKAYMTLDAILAEEKRYLSSIGAPSASDPMPTANNLMPSEPLEPSEPSEPTGASESSPGSGSDNDDFFDADEHRQSDENTETYIGKLSSDAHVTQQLERMEVQDSVEKRRSLQRSTSAFPPGPDTDVFGGNRVDAFIHAGSNMCYGLLLIMVSMLPPAFSTLTRIVGFKGDRKRGLALLWQATKFGDMNGAFAGLVLLGYYNSMLGFCDILPTSGTGAYPKERCRALLKEFRKQYPGVRRHLSHLERSSLTSRAGFGCLKSRE